MHALISRYNWGNYVIDWFFLLTSYGVILNWRKVSLTTRRAVQHCNSQHWKQTASPPLLKSRLLIWKLVLRAQHQKTAQCPNPEPVLKHLPSSSSSSIKWGSALYAKYGSRTTARLLYLPIPTPHLLYSTGVQGWSSLCQLVKDGGGISYKDF